jgi:hypothetical protein
MYFLLSVENRIRFGVLKANAEGTLGSNNFDRRKKVIGGEKEIVKNLIQLSIKKTPQRIL